VCLNKIVLWALTFSCIFIIPFSLANEKVDFSDTNQENDVYLDIIRGKISFKYADAEKIAQDYLTRNQEDDGWHDNISD